VRYWQGVVGHGAGSHTSGIAPSSRVKNAHPPGTSRTRRAGHPGSATSRRFRGRMPIPGYLPPSKVQFDKAWPGTPRMPRHRQERRDRSDLVTHLCDPWGARDAVSPAAAARHWNGMGVERWDLAGRRQTPSMPAGASPRRPSGRASADKPCKVNLQADTKPQKGGVPRPSMLRYLPNRLAGDTFA
jgi:hypothetical protein